MTAPADLPKTYDPSTVEAETYRTWLEEKSFQANPAAPGEPYSIVIPPPNVTGALHLGHAINNTLQDILIRQHRMAGFNTVWIPGLDHAGIATQAVVEKQLKEQENKTRHDVGREGLVERIWAWKQQYGDRILNQLQRLGASCDWSRTHFTLDDQCARAVRETFFKLFRDGLIYRGKRLVNWDVHLQTSISDDEIYHETVKTFLWHISYPIVSQEELNTEQTENTEKKKAENGQERNQSDSSLSSSVSSVISVFNPSSRPTHMTVATTRPETLLGDTAVAVHSQDPRWNWAIGKQVQLPLTDRKIPIIADDILVDPKFGSGVVKVTPAHDPNDYAVYQRHQNQPDQIDIINILNSDGTLNANAGPAYAGMKREPARKKVVEDLKAAGLLVKEEPYETQVGHSDRSKTAVEPYLSDQWFVKMAPLAEPALKVVEDGTIKFFPERHRQQYLSWLGEKRDWPISRQLWWGHRIPVWHSRVTCTTSHQVCATFFQDGVIEPLMLGMDAEVAACVVIRANDGIRLTDSEAELRRIERIIANIPGEDFADKKLPEPLVYDIYVCTTSNDWASKNLERDFTQDPDVLDTWFSSALWPHSTLGWPDATADLAKWYPTSVLLTGRDIITLWVARMVMTGMYNMGRNAEVGTRNAEVKANDVPSSSTAQHSAFSVQRSLGVPFAHVAINPTILDEYGRRMSKSAGNGVDPVDIIQTHGADALRFTLTTMATETQDARMPVKIVCPQCQTLIANPESNKVPTVTCPKCKTVVTRPLGTQTGTPEAPLGRMTSEKFDLGRNFCNKLWNAARFALSNLSSAPTSAFSAQRSAFSLPDRWILSRFTKTVAEANAALSIYRFDQYAKTCYDFFWRDFCDWYVEAIKPAMKDPNRAPQTAQVLATVLDGALRLMHPMIPFITERLWWQLNQVRAQRGIPSALECPPGERLIRANWPKPQATDEPAEATFATLQEIIVAIRNVRNEHKVDVKKPVTVMAIADASNAITIESNCETIELLATCTIAVQTTATPPPPDAQRMVVGKVELLITGFAAGKGADDSTLAKQRATLDQKIATLKARMANPAYTEKAPPQLVQQTRDELTVAEAERAKLG